MLVLRSVRSWGRWAPTAASAHSGARFPFFPPLHEICFFVPVDFNIARNRDFPAAGAMAARAAAALAFSVAALCALAAVVCTFSADTVFPASVSPHSDVNSTIFRLHCQLLLHTRRWRRLSCSAAIQEAELTPRRSFGCFVHVLPCKRSSS